jgi:hypothetical protein
MKYGNLVERDYGPPAEGAERFHIMRWTIVMRAALIQCNGGSPLWPDCGGSIGIHSAYSLGAAGIRRQRSTRRSMRFAKR